MLKCFLARSWNAFLEFVLLLKVSEVLKMLESFSSKPQNIEEEEIEFGEIFAKDIVIPKGLQSEKNESKYLYGQ